MKRDTKKRAALFTFYALFVILLLLGTRCESRPHLTTPERDAKHLAELASTIRTEAELRAVEKIASEYEIAYRKSYGGATALYFKSLYEPIMDEAGERRAVFRNEEEYIDQINTTLSTTLEDLELAWSMSLGTEEEERAKLEANNLIIEEYNDERDVLVEAKEQLAMDIIEAGYPQNMLDEIGKLEGEIVKVDAKIKEVEHNNNIIILAYRLQRGEELNPTLGDILEDVFEFLTDDNSDE